MLVRFLAVFACGLAAAASIGKLVPHLKWMAERFDVPLAASGFAVSAVMLPGVLLGPVLGLAVDRAGAKRVALAGLGLQACASLALAFAASFPVLVAVRIVEGFGYSIAVVAATVLVVESAGPRHQTFALAVWSAFAPLGFALGQWFAGAISEPNPLPLVGEAHALALGACALLLLVFVPHAAGADGSGASFFSATLSHPPALRTALAFGFCTGALLGAVALAPLVLAPHAGLTVAATAQLTAAAALPGILGRVISGWLLGGEARPYAVFSAAATLGCVVLAIGLGMPLPLAAALGCFAAFQIAIGALPGVMSAMLPWVAPTPQQLGTVSGLANQMITAGNLLAPPLVLGVYAAWGVFGALGVLFAAIGSSVALIAGVAVYHKPLAAR
jgi:MFS transporter, CP family, cyanate transporter